MSTDESKRLIGRELIKIGWRQGSIVTKDDVISLISDDTYGLSENSILIVISQSCDIGCWSDEKEPDIECILGSYIKNIDKRLASGTSSRKFHLGVIQGTEDESFGKTVYVELLAKNKIHLNKASFSGLSPNDKSKIDSAQMETFTSWLATRYSRPAFPDNFDKAIDREKLKELAKKVNPLLSGIYINLIPFEELDDPKQYSLDLLGLISPNTTVPREDIQNLFEEYAQVIRDCFGFNIFKENGEV